jgi:arabinose-5-phosphate isomerase
MGKDNDSAKNALEYGRQILHQEALAVGQLTEMLDQNFSGAVSTILEIPAEGRLIACGMGKAGIIAQKISATFASTGLPSFFLHPAEALHGDIGRYTDKDVALILSNSGETEEIIKIIPSLKRLGCPIIAISSSSDSTLAKHSDYVLLNGAGEEAGPLGLAPTTSTTTMLALGDALAMAVLNERGLSREQFARNHPGGNLGRLLMVVSEVMRVEEELCLVEESLNTREVLHRYTATKGRPGAAIVVDSQGKLSGIFTDGDLRRYLDQGTDFLDKPIGDMMSGDPRTLTPDTLVQEALGFLSKYKIDQVVIVDQQNKPVGLLDVQDLIMLKMPSAGHTI